MKCPCFFSRRTQKAFHSFSETFIFEKTMEQQRSSFIQSFSKRRGLSHCPDHQIIQKTEITKRKARAWLPWKPTTIDQRLLPTSSSTYDATRLGIGLRLGAAQRSEDGESCGQVFESVRFGSTSGSIEQLTQEEHRGVRLARTAATCNRAKHIL